MADKASYQHAQTNGDRKTFTSPPARSPAFGVEAREAQMAKGNVPGSSQWEPLSPDPETP